MKIRNEVWMIKADGSIIKKERKAGDYEWVVVYTVSDGFQTVTNSATIISLGDGSGTNLHLSCTLQPETTFPEMLASFHDETDEKILNSLKFYGFDISNSGVQRHVLKAVKYAWEHIGEFEPKEIKWRKI